MHSTRRCPVAASLGQHKLEPAREACPALTQYCRRHDSYRGNWRDGPLQATLR